MAKSKQRKASTKSRSDTNEPAEPLAHNPFGSLVALEGSLPQGPLQTASAIKPDTPVRVSPRFPNKLVLRREVKGRGGKTVTRISGVPRLELEQLAKQMKKSLGCGASVDAPDIVLLGSLVDRAADWLEKAGASKVVKGN